MAIKTKKTPSSAKVTYSTNDASIASVYDGTITANGVGTATITAKMTCGTKVVKKTIKVTVVAGLEDGITATLTNAVNENYPNATLISAASGYGDASFRIYYGKNGKGVADSTLEMKYTIDDPTSGRKKEYSQSQTTDANGLATFYVDNDGLGVVNVDYTITAVATGVKTTGSVAFAKVTTDPITNINGIEKDKTRTVTLPNGNTIKRSGDYVKEGYAKLAVSENDKNGSYGDGRTMTSGTFSTYHVDANTGSAIAGYFTEYVDSQQVSIGTEHQVGFVGGLPYIELPGKSADLNSATIFKQNVGITSNEYHTYANDAQYIPLSVDPSELTYATMNFSSLKLSANTKLVIETYTSKEAAEKSDKDKRVGTSTEVTGPHDQSNFSYQIPLTTKGSGLCIKVTLKSAGQVNTDLNKGYTISDITGVYKNKTTSSDNTVVLMKGAKITWSKTDVKFSEEKTLSDADIARLNFDSSLVHLKSYNTSEGKKVTIKKVTYRVPVYPYTGNAVITTYDENNKVLAYYACPTQNEYGTKTNTNTLDFDADYVYQISQEEAFNNVGDITSQNDDFVTVNSKLAGTTALQGTITGVNGLDASNSTVYTSVQWNPVKATTSTKDTGAIAFTGQNVEIVAQLLDGNGNAVSTQGQKVVFKYGSSETPINSGMTIPASDRAVVTGGPVSVVKVDDSTDTKGQAKLTLNAAKVTTLLGVTATVGNKSYDVVLTISGQNVEKADVYWIDAKPAFVPDVDADEETGKVVSGKCKPYIDETWEYGFTLQKQKLEGGVFDGYTVSITDANIALATVKNTDGTTNVATVNTATGTNGMATAKSSKTGKTTFEATVDGSPVSGKTVMFNVSDDKGVSKGSFASVGTGKTAFVNKQKLEVEWQTKGITGTFDTANGVNATTGNPFTLYFKVADTNGNPLKDKDVTVQSDKGTPGVSGTKTGTNGLIAITLSNVGKNDGEKEVVTATVDNVPYTTVVTWNAAGDAECNVNDRDISDNHYTTNWNGDTITLTFTKDILASSVDAAQFTVVYGDGSTNEYAVESATVDGNVITLKVKNGPATTSINNTYTVNIKSIVKNGINISVKTVDGAKLDAVSNTTGTGSISGIHNIAK